MLNYTPHPVLFEFGSVTIHSWGVMFALGFLVALFLGVRQAKKAGMDPEHIYITVIVTFLGTLVGSKMFSLIYASEGMVSYGFFVGIGCAWVYLRYKKINPWQLFDILVPYIALGCAITRIGCFLNWDDYGIASTLPWAVQVVTDVARHPTNLYLSFMHLGIFFFLVTLRDRKTLFSKKLQLPQGFLFLLGLWLYSILRFCIEFIRYYEDVSHHSISSSLLLILFMVTSLLLYLKYNEYAKPVL